MKQLELHEIEFVVGGGFFGQVGGGLVGWAVSKAADAATKAVSDMNQGGSPAYTDQLGNVT